jgi:signal transduction histidine kinase
MEVLMDNQAMTVSAVSPEMDTVEELKLKIGQLQKENAGLRQDLADANIEVEAITDEFQRNQAEIEQAKKDVERAKEAAERANNVKSAFLASMSHELRTPLNSIINFSKFVAQGVMGPVNDEQREALGEVIDSGKHLLSLINDVLDMSKIEAGALRLFTEDNVNVTTILESALTTAKSLVADKPVDVTLEIEKTLPLIRADRQRLLQVMLNILSNACKFTEKGSIRIKAHSNDDTVVLSVADSGPGIAKEDQAAVFEPFKQTDTGLRQGGGTGLGMPISKKLAEAHGGNLWVESQKGEGATFFVTIPITKPATSPSA